MTTPTRVLYLSHAFAVGGAEEMVLNLVRHLPPSYVPAVACIHEAGPIGLEIERTGVPFKVLGLTPGLRHPFDLLRLRDFLYECQPDIVHTFLLTGSLYGRFAALMARVPVVIGTEVNVYERKHALHARAERWLMRDTDAVVASAESVRDFYIRQVKADPAKVEVIYNAVDWAQLQATVSRDEMRASVEVPAGAPLLTIIARLTEQKGHRILLDALARTDLAHAYLLVVGDGPLRDVLERQAANLGLSARVRFLGARRDLGGGRFEQARIFSIFVEIGGERRDATVSFEFLEGFIDHRHSAKLSSPGGRVAMLAAAGSGSGICHASREVPASDDGFIDRRRFVFASQVRRYRVRSRRLRVDTAGD